MQKAQKIAEFKFDYRKPFICTAIHNGHQLSEIIEKNMALTVAERLYEEDPYTGFFTELAGNRAIVNYSRFQMDLNRPQSRSYYLKPEQSWGLKVRRSEPTKEEIEHSAACYKWFYDKIKLRVEKMIDKFDQIFVYDLHSYNHQRKGEGMEYDDPSLNPEIIIGTNNMPEKYFPLVDRIMNQLRSEDYFGRQLDVRLNIKFDGGHFSRWLHSSYPGSICCLALEFKKIFMNEWTGEIDWEKAKRLRLILSSTFKMISKEIMPI
jgi:N-formylglutamate deformylase